MKKTTTVHAADKKLGMSVPELVKALRGAKPGVAATAVVSITGRIKSITLTEMKEQEAQ
jgi:hypothetical protein